MMTLDQPTIKALTTKILAIIDKIEHVVSTEPPEKGRLSVIIGPIGPGFISIIYYSQEDNAIKIAVPLRRHTANVTKTTYSIPLSAPDCFQQLENDIRHIYNEINIYRNQNL